MTSRIDTTGSVSLRGEGGSWRPGEGGATGSSSKGALLQKHENMSQKERVAIAKEVSGRKMETYASARAVGFRFGFRPDFLTTFVLLAGRVGLEGSSSVGSVRFRVGARSVSVP